MYKPESESIRVLVVDDDAALAELTATFLRRHDVAAKTATSAEAGLRRLGIAPDSNEAPAGSGTDPEARGTKQRRVRVDSSHRGRRAGPL
jgi:hypothetical protein